MFQIHSYGIPADVNFSEGAQTTRSDIPLGLKITDGSRAYRWAHIKESTYYPGMAVARDTDSAVLALAGSYFRSRARDGYDQAGSLYLYLYSAAIMVADKFINGDIAFVSGAGKGHTYPIESYEVGAAGARNKIKLVRPLRAAISDSSQIKLISNKYWGCKKTKASVRLRYGDENIILGGLTQSDGDVSNTSGFQWVQVAGIGPGFHSAAVISAGSLLGAVNCGILNPAITVLSVNYLTASSLAPIARAVGGGAATDDFGVVDWTIETP